METSCWIPSASGGRKPAETSGVYFGSLKTFILSVTLENIRIGTSLNILVTQNSKTLGELIFSCTQHVTLLLPKNNADVTHCEKPCVSKQSGLPSWRQAKRYMLKNDFYLMEVKTWHIFNFSFLLTSHENQEFVWSRYRNELPWYWFRF